MQFVRNFCDALADAGHPIRLLQAGRGTKADGSSQGGARMPRRRNQSVFGSHVDVAGVRPAHEGTPLRLWKHVVLPDGSAEPQWQALGNSGFDEWLPEAHGKKVRGVAATQDTP